MATAAINKIEIRKTREFMNLSTHLRCSAKEAYTHNKYK